MQRPMQDTSMLSAVGDASAATTCNSNNNSRSSNKNNGNNAAADERISFSSSSVSIIDESLSNNSRYCSRRHHRSNSISDKNNKATSTLPEHTIRLPNHYNPGSTKNHGGTNNKMTRNYNHTPNKQRRRKTAPAESIICSSLLLLDSSLNIKVRRRLSAPPPSSLLFDPSCSSSTVTITTGLYENSFTPMTKNDDSYEQRILPNQFISSRRRCSAPAKSICNILFDSSSTQKRRLSEAPMKNICSSIINEGLIFDPSASSLTVKTTDTSSSFTSMTKNEFIPADDEDEQRIIPNQFISRSLACSRFTSLTKNDFVAADDNMERRILPERSVSRSTNSKSLDCNVTIQRRRVSESSKSTYTSTSDKRRRRVSAPGSTCSKGLLFDASSSSTSTVTTGIRSKGMMFDLSDDNSEESSSINENLADDFCFFSLTTATSTSTSPPHSAAFNDSFVIVEEDADEKERNDANNNTTDVDNKIHQGYRLKTKGLHRVHLPKDRSMRSLCRDDLFSTRSNSNCILSESFSTKVAGVITINKQGISNRRYACKELKDEFITATGRNKNKDACEVFIKAAIELAYEARALSSLVHPNIIKIHGWGNSNTSNDATAYSSSKFFFLMDVLKENLEERITRWKSGFSCRTWSNYPREPPPVTKGSSSSLGDHFAYHIRNIEKIQNCYELSRALEYIHSKNIIYKNLNPNTIGFCFDLDFESDSSSLKNRGVLKLFDFASSCCTINNQWYNDSKKTTATMAYHYMAPEMFMNNSYIDCKCDIYSFSMVCWKIFSHQTPFQSLTPQHYEEFVYLRGHRPVQNPAGSSYGRDQPRLFQHLEEWAWRNNTQSLSFSSYDHQHNHDDEHDNTPMDAEVPEEVYNLLSKGWKSKPCSRIGLDEIQIQLILVRRLEELRLQKKMPNNKDEDSNIANDNNR